MTSPLEGVRGMIRGQVRHLVGSGDSLRNGHDDGLFGPGSASWAVHGDFTAMMIGGISALLVQMLHPAALAGVWDHSDFRRDMPGRLRRTARFIAGTTYGSTDEVTALIARVRSIHDRVRGTLPDGTLYRANDPALLTWVHVAEVDSFLRSHLRYVDPGFPAAAQDRYCAEYARVAEALGAVDVPTTRRGIDAYFRAMRPRLRVDARTREVAAALFAQAAPTPAMAPMGALMLEAGVDLLPPWAAAMHGRHVALHRRPALRIGVQGMGSVLRWAMAGG